MRESLRTRDVGTVFRFLASRGWSRAAIASATGLAENRVRAVARGAQLISSYDVLVRIAEGLRIDRGLMGLAFSNETSSAGPGGDASEVKLPRLLHPTDVKGHVKVTAGGR